MTLLQTSLRGGVLILVLALFRLLFFRFVPKRLLPRLWLGAVLLLLCPVPIESSLSVYGLLRAGSPAASAAAPPLPPAALWSGCGLCAVLLGAVYGVGLRRFRLAEPVEDGRIASWLAAHPLRRRLQVKRADRARVPLSGGVLRPVILLPGKYLRLPDPALSCVLEHEWVHVKHFHALYKLLLGAALCLHWFNPAVWLLVWLAGRDLEYAADEAAVESGVPRSAYARLLLEAAGPQGLFSTAFSGNARRLKSLLRPRQPGKRAGLLFGLLGLLLLFGFATVPVTEAKEPAETKGSLSAREEADALRTMIQAAEVKASPAALSAEETEERAAPMVVKPVLSVRQEGTSFCIQAPEAVPNEEEALLLSVRLAEQYCPEGSRYVVAVGFTPCLDDVPPVQIKEMELLLSGLREGEIVRYEPLPKREDGWVFLGKAPAGI